MAGITSKEYKCFNEAYCEWETSIEHQFAQNIMKGNEHDIAKYFLHERFKELIKKETEILFSQSLDKILFIGSGPFPISAFNLNRIIGKPIDCLERDSSVALKSQQLIEKLGMQDAIRVFTGAGESFDVSQYDLIVIALLAKPKWAILRNIRKNANPKCRVLCRTSYGLRNLLYEPLQERSLQGFKVLDKQIAGYGQTISTLLLEPGKRAAKDLHWRWLNQIDANSKIRILRLMNRILERETTIGFPSPLTHEAGLELLAKLDEDLRAGDRYVLVGEQGDEILAHAILTPHALPNCKHLAEVSRAMVDPSVRGAGVVRLGFQQIVNQCEDLEIEKIYLDARADSRVAEQWKAFGFEVFGILSDYARVGDKQYRGVYMHQAIADLKQRVF